MMVVGAWRGVRKREREREKGECRVCPCSAATVHPSRPPLLARGDPLCAASYKTATFPATRNWWPLRKRSRSSATRAELRPGKREGLRFTSTLEGGALLLWLSRDANGPLLPRRKLLDEGQAA